MVCTLSVMDKAFYWNGKLLISKLYCTEDIHDFFLSGVGL